MRPDTIMIKTTSKTVSADTVTELVLSLLTAGFGVLALADRTIRQHLATQVRVRDSASGTFLSRVGSSAAV